MINIDLLKDTKDEKLWQIEEIVKTLDGIAYWREDFLSYSGPANDVSTQAENRLRDIIYSPTFRELDANYITLALFLRETAHWFVHELVSLIRDIDIPPNIYNGYKMYLDYCFYRTEKDEIIRYKTIEELRENLFEQYKHNRNVMDNNKDNIKILKLLTIINEYEQIINENERLRTN